MYNKTLFFLLFLLLPLFAEAGFPIGKGTVVRSSGTTISASPREHMGGYYRYTKRSKSDDAQITEANTAHKNLNTISFLLAVGGLLAIGAIIAFWLTSLAGVIAAAALVLLLGMGALGTGYISAYNHNENTLGLAGFIIGMVESLPVILVGGLLVSIYEIGRFVFRRKHKKHQD